MGNKKNNNLKTSSLPIKMCWGEKIDYCLHVLVFLCGLAVFLPWFCRFVAALDVIFAGCREKSLETLKNNQHISQERRRVTVPKALLVYFGRVKAIQVRVWL